MGNRRVDGAALARNQHDTRPASDGSPARPPVLPGLRYRVGRAAASAIIAATLALLPPFSSAARAIDAPSDPAPSDESVADARAYGYEGSLNGVLAADGTVVDMEGETVQATEPGQNALLAHNGGWASTQGGTLAKSGDGAEEDDCTLYGVNSIALAANAGSGAILSNTSLVSDSKGANGLFATDSATIFANGPSISTTTDDSCGIVATYAGTIVANDLAVSTQGGRSSAIAVGLGGGSVSVTNSSLNTSGTESPLLYSTGSIEADNVTGRTSGSQLIGLVGPSSVKLDHSNLSSSATGQAGDGPLANGAIVCQPGSEGEDDKSGQAALFQAHDSTLSSSIQSGALFYLADMQAKVVLADTNLEFESSAAKLLEVSGSGTGERAASTRGGASTTFTGIQQKLKGDIEVDDASSVDLFLLEGSSWNGSSAIAIGSGSSSVTDNLTVNIDATSSWTVSKNSTVSSLNMASGGRLVDEDGKSVKIVDADGLTLVDGASDISITVNDDFSTSVKADSAGELEGAAIDRAEFDSTFDTQTAFGTNGTDGDTATSEQAEQVIAAIREWFRNL